MDIIEQFLNATLKDGSPDFQHARSRARTQARRERARRA
jgi:hypothetical protein